MSDKIDIDVDAERWVFKGSMIDLALHLRGNW